MSFEVVYYSPDTLALLCDGCHSTLATWKAMNPGLDELNELAEEHRKSCDATSDPPPRTNGIMLRRALPGDTRLA